MSLDKETVRNLNMQCRRALKKPLQFVYCPEGADGEPVLIIDKNVKVQLNELKKTAKRKKFVIGRITKKGKILTFYPRAAPDKLSRDLKNTFAKKVPLLKTVAIVSPEEAKAERQEQGREPAKLSKLSAKIGQRASSFRKAPEKQSEARLNQLLSNIETYRGAGGRTDYSNLESELRAQLKSRQQQPEDDDQPYQPFGDEPVDDESTISHPFDDLSPEEAEKLNALATTINQQEAEFRENPHKLSEEKLEQLLSDIGRYQALVKDEGFYDKLKKDLKRTLSKQRVLPKIMLGEEKVYKKLAKRLPESHKRLRALKAEKKRQEDYRQAWDNGIGMLRINATRGSNAGVDLSTNAKVALKAARQRVSVVRATFKKMLEELKWAKLSEEVGLHIGRSIKVLKKINDVNDMIGKLFDALQFYPPQRADLFKNLGNKQKLVIAWGANTAQQRAAFDARVQEGYELAKKSAFLEWNAEIPATGLILQAIDASMGAWSGESYGKARAELIQDGIAASADVWKYETHLKMGRLLIEARKSVFFRTDPPGIEVYERKARRFKNHINRTADYYDYAAKHYPQVIERLKLPPVPRQKMDNH